MQTIPRICPAGRYITSTFIMSSRTQFCLSPNTFFNKKFPIYAKLLYTLNIMGIFNLIVLAALGLAVGITMFYGIVNLTKKSFQPSSQPSVDSSQMLHEQQLRQKDMAQRQKDLQRRQAQQMKDLQRMQKR